MSFTVVFDLKELSEIVGDYLIKSENRQRADATLIDLFGQLEGTPVALSLYCIQIVIKALQAGGLDSDIVWQYALPEIIKRFAQHEAGEDRPPFNQVTAGVMKNVIREMYPPIPDIRNLNFSVTNASGEKSHIQAQVSD